MLRSLIERDKFPAGVTAGDTWWRAKVHDVGAIMFLRVVPPRVDRQATLAAQDV